MTHVAPSFVMTVFAIVLILCSVPPLCVVCLYVSAPRSTGHAHSETEQRANQQLTCSNWMKQVHIPDFLNNISTDCDTPLMQHYSITVRWQRKCTCNIGCMLQVGSHPAIQPTLLPPKTSQPVDHCWSTGWVRRWYLSCGGVTALGHDLNNGWIGVPRDNNEESQLPTGLPGTLFYNAVPGLMLQQFLDDVHQLRGLTRLYRWDKTAPRTSAWSISLHNKSDWKVISVELHKTMGLHKALCDFSIA